MLILDLKNQHLAKVAVRRVRVFLISLTVGRQLPSGLLIRSQNGSDVMNRDCVSFFVTPSAVLLPTRPQYPGTYIRVIVFLSDRAWRFSKQFKVSIDSKVRALRAFSATQGRDKTYLGLYPTTPKHHISEQHIPVSVLVLSICHRTDGY